VTSRWLRRSGSPRNEDHMRSAQALLTTTFLDMEKRQGMVESAFQAAHAFSPTSVIEREWEAVRDGCYEAVDAYLQATAPADEADASWQNSPERMTTLHRAQQLLAEARRGLDEFEDRHRQELDAAAARAVAVSTQADTAVSAAHGARQRLTGTDETLLAYPSVQQARDQMEAAYHVLALARERHDLAGVNDGAERLSAAVTAVIDALTRAPQSAEQARRTVASVRTRVQALRHRADSVAPYLSALLREFHADSSSDLAGNERTSRIHLDRSDALLTQAAAAHGERRPEAALDLAAQSRAELADAERLIDAVSDRLDLLRQLRSDPTVKEREVRFRLRDAQRLAVDRGADKEWGSALDAQVQRIDRIVAGLSGRHPDYWAYHGELDDVSQFVATIVARIRQRSVQ
jgi:hypothetical protein